MVGIHTVRITPSGLKDYRRFCKAARAAMPNEYLESLVGKIEDGVAEIHHLWPIRHTKSTNWCVASFDDVAEHKRLALAKGMIWLGDIHSHPHVASSHYLSKGDHAAGIDCGAALIGSCKVAEWGKGIRVWKPHFAVPALLKVEGF